MYFYKWNQQINSSSYRRETSTRFTFLLKAQNVTHPNSYPQKSSPCKHPISTTATRHSRALATFLWFRLQAQFLYYIRGKGRLMGRYSKYNEKKKKSWRRAERQGPNPGLPPGGYVTPKQATCMAAFNSSSTLYRIKGTDSLVLFLLLSCAANKVYVGFSVVVSEHCSQIKAMMVSPHSVFTFAWWARISSLTS